MTRFTIDAAASVVTFTGSSSLHPIVATAPGAGWFEADVTGGRFEPDTMIAGRLEVPIVEIRSGNPLIDAETRRRFGRGATRAIIAEITDTLHVDDASARVEGTVTLLDETTTVEGEIMLATGPVLTGEGQFDVRWWGMKPPRLLAVRVHPEVVVRIRLRLVAERP